MNNFNKQPSETFPIAIDFSEVLGNAETISLRTVTASIHYGGSGDATSTVIDSSLISLDNVDVTVKGGTSGLTYKITTKITTSLGNISEEDVLMKVMEL